MIENSVNRERVKCLSSLKSSGFCFADSVCVCVCVCVCVQQVDKNILKVIPTTLLLSLLIFLGVNGPCEFESVNCIA